MVSVLDIHIHKFFQFFDDQVRTRTSVKQITHNMQMALDMGNRIIMMNNGSIIFDAAGEEKKHLTVEDLMEQFKIAAGKSLDNDRMLL